MTSDLENTTHCSECGAVVHEGTTCRMYLDEMIKWDFEDFAGVGQIHHLTVLSYNLQHPSVYSKKGLEDAKQFLEEFFVQNATFEEHDERNKRRLSSDVRDWKITGRPEDHGSYAAEPHWTMTAADVVSEGLENYVGNVKKWSMSVYESLKESGEFDTLSA